MLSKFLQTSFSRSLVQFFLTVDQNNFGNKIPFLWPREKINGHVYCIFFMQFCNFAKDLYSFIPSFEQSQISENRPQLCFWSQYSPEMIFPRSTFCFLAGDLNFHDVHKIRQMKILDEGICLKASMYLLLIFYCSLWFIHFL